MRSAALASRVSVRVRRFARLIWVLVAIAACLSTMPSSGGDAVFSRDGKRILLFVRTIWQARTHLANAEVRNASLYRKGGAAGGTLYN